MIARLDKAFSFGPRSTAEKILTKLCINANLNPSETDLGIADFYSISTRLANLIDVEIPYQLYGKLLDENKMIIREMLVMQLQHVIASNSQFKSNFKYGQNNKVILPETLFGSSYILSRFLHMTFKKIREMMRQSKELEAYMPLSVNYPKLSEYYAGHAAKFMIKCLIGHPRIEEVEDYKHCASILKKVLHDNVDFILLYQLSNHSYGHIINKIFEEFKKIIESSPNHYLDAEGVKIVANGVTRNKSYLQNSDWGDPFLTDVGKYRLPSSVFESTNLLNDKLSPVFSSVREKLSDVFCKKMGGMKGVNPGLFQNHFKEIADIIDGYLVNSKNVLSMTHPSLIRKK